MDWRNNKFWRKNVRRLDETTAEFDLLVQRTINGIEEEKKIRRSIQLLERTSNSSQKGPEGLGDELEKMKNTVKELNAKYEAMLGAMNK